MSERTADVAGNGTGPGTLGVAQDLVADAARLVEEGLEAGDAVTEAAALHGLDLDPDQREAAAFLARCKVEGAREVIRS